MEGSTKICFLLNGTPTIICCKKFGKHSNLITDLLSFIDDKNHPIPMPPFVTKTMLFDIMRILESDNLQCISDSSVDYLIKIVRYDKLD